LDLIEKENNSIQEELNHWWIKTRFLYIDKSIQLVKKKDIDIIEYGCGTGQNIFYLSKIYKNLSNIKSIYGIDPNIEKNNKPFWIKKEGGFLKEDNNILKKFDIILALDVLEHIENDYEYLDHWVKKLNKKGIILIIVPAFPHLWSSHDLKMKHKRRYTKKSLIELTKKINLTPLKINYLFSYMHPINYFLRVLLKSENYNHLKIPNPFINNILIKLGKIEAAINGSSYFGTSVMGIFKKK
jgi:SAM-dependent methyltransferase